MFFQIFSSLYSSFQIFSPVCFHFALISHIPLFSYPIF
ncbi:hypothetical protein EVA_12251 [gut metagenome]|uniref:Uncharacterized protein n=1 Tax=gut metagenome TaxID=749906 RepID=J9FYJ6_9ZZZZ